MKDYLDANEDKMYELGDLLFKTPELGYKEFETKKILTSLFEEHGIKTRELGSETAFCVTLGKGKPHIGLIAELDGIPTLGHKYANKNDSNAAHACGHSSQCVAMAYAFLALAKQGIDKGKVTLFFTPAEEFTDVEYRRRLIKEKKIRYIGGKTNMLADGLFDDVDMFIHLHGMGNEGYDFSVGGRLGGFTYKKISFLGKASHAAVAPEKGIDAMDMFVDFYAKMKEIRNAYPKEDLVRIHGIIIEGGQSVNSIPERVTYELYNRSIDPMILQELNKRIDEAAKKAAKDHKGKVKIETIPGYLPLMQDDNLNEIIAKSISKYSGNIRYGHDSIAAGDVGDISMFKPIIQFGYAGFEGAFHSKDFCIKDNKKVYLLPAKIVRDSVNELLNNKEAVRKIKKYQPLMSKEEYLEYLKG